jgi:hypothetical protein
MMAKNKFHTKKNKCKLPKKMALAVSLNKQNKVNKTAV